MKSLDLIHPTVSETDFMLERFIQEPDILKAPICRPRGKSCLVVDDNCVLRKIARRILEQNGFEVSEAENGQIALESCRKNMPDSILMDWNMPLMNGIECLKALRREFGDECPQVVFCTVENDITFIKQAIEHGAQEFIMKPFDEEILLSKFCHIGLL